MAISHSDAIQQIIFFFFQAEDGIRDFKCDWSSDVCSSDLMAQAKAMLESIARSYGQRYGRTKKVRVNTISQSPTKTTAGAGISGFDVFFDYANLMSPRSEERRVGKDGRVLLYASGLR